MTDVIAITLHQEGHNGHLADGCLVSYWPLQHDQENWFNPDRFNTFVKLDISQGVTVMNSRRGP